MVWSNYTRGNGFSLYFHDQDVFFRKIDGGSLSNTIDVSNSPFPSSNPQVAISGNNVYIAWNHQDKTGQYDTWFRRSADNGVSFKAPVNLSNDPGNSYDLQVVATLHNVYVAWTDDSYGSTEVFFRNMPSATPENSTVRS